MVFVTTNGTIIDIFGPFKATLNDAKIMKIVFEKNVIINEKLQKNDVFLLDRGFRDCIQFLKDAGYDPKMPELIQKNNENQNQLTMQQANASRIVTACRFVVEIRNGHLKSIWKIFGRTWTSYEIPHLMKDIRIASALINKFRIKIESNADDAAQIADGMKDKLISTNQFSKIVNSNAFQRKIKNCVEIDSHQAPFQIISIEELKNISLGSYQLRLARSYIVEHMKRSGRKFELFQYPNDCIDRKTFECFVNNGHVLQNMRIFLSKLFSRFRKDKHYKVFVMTDISIKDFKGILGYSCDCKHGLRTVGSCGHVMALISYLSHYRLNMEAITEVARAIKEECFPSDSD